MTLSTLLRPSRQSTFHFSLPCFQLLSRFLERVIWFLGLIHAPLSLFYGTADASLFYSFHKLVAAATAQLVLSPETAACATGLGRPDKPLRTALTSLSPIPFAFAEQRLNSCYTQTPSGREWRCMVPFFLLSPKGRDPAASLICS